MTGGPERVQQLEHAKRLLQLRIDQLHLDQQRIEEERGRLQLQIRKHENEMATIVSAHLVDA